MQSLSLRLFPAHFQMLYTTGIRLKPPAPVELDEVGEPIPPYVCPLGEWPPKDSCLDINAQDEYGCTPSHYAAACLDFTSLRWLHGVGVDLIAQDKRGLVPLDFALQACGVSVGAEGESAGAEPPCWI